MPEHDAERTRLTRILLGLFTLLALPMGVLIWQAFDQLKFEAFYQHRNQAEALATRIDSRLAEAVRSAEARGFSDYSFLNVTGAENPNVLQRSPLAAFPVRGEIPGTLGYFQIDASGTFSTPLLPTDSAASLGIPSDEQSARERLADELMTILAENRLVPDSGLGRLGSALPAAPEETASVRPGLETRASGAEPVAVEEAAAQSEADMDAGPADANNLQQAFDDLIPMRQRVRGNDRIDSAAPTAATSADVALASDLRDQLEIDESLEEKSAALAKRRVAADSAKRERRLEQAALPETVSINASGSLAEREQTTRITTFESEIDPYYFRLLDTGHFVLFRRVWRDSQRYVQGILLDRREFLQNGISSEFQASPLAEMTDMILGYHGEVLYVGGSTEASHRYPASAGELRGTHLFSQRLAAPLDDIQLAFTIRRMPLGPGARVLAWTSAAFGLVLVVGFAALYRLGISQLRVARQQQDFVSAVSHELKTPLTSIRMYGEMLNEGWVEDSKRKKYYAYIHDEAERLTRLIANVLRLARITRSEERLELEPVTVGEALAGIQEKVGSQIERAGFTLELDAAQDTRDYRVRVDRDALVQIFINLIDNALKFSKDAGQKTIELRCSRSGDDALFTVRDYGPGIPKEQLKKIFLLFYRGESELTRETVGTGIGLAIVNELATAMRGRVDVVNVAPGAEFQLRLPLES